MKKYYIFGIVSLIIGLIMAFLPGCKVNKAIASPFVSSVLYYIPDPIVTISHAKHDTIKLKIPVSTKERDAYLSQFYKQGFDKYFAPQFNKMNGIIANQAVAINGFQDIITRMRARAISHNDSLASQSQYYIKQALKAQNDAIRYQKLYIDQTKLQIKSYDRLTVVFLLGSIIIFGIVIALWFRVNSLSKKFDKLISHA